MFLSQYNMYLNEDESHPVRAGLRRGTMEGSWGGGVGRGVLCKRLSKTGSGLDSEGELAFCGLLAIPAPERPHRVREVTCSRVAPTQ